MTTDAPVSALPIWQRCWCYRYGRCLVDCPTADLPRPVPFTDANWQAAYLAVIERKLCPWCGVEIKLDREMCSTCESDTEPCYGR